MRTVHEYIIICWRFLSKTLAWPVCCTSSKHSYESMSPHRHIHLTESERPVLFGMIVAVGCETNVAG